MQRLVRLVARLRAKRWATLCAINLRILIGFAFVPAGLKKLLGQPFTDPDSTGRFHDFLHAFHATGGFYRAVGALQLAAALLLITQRFAFAGALLVLPVLTAIVTFCWSTAVYPTATVATLMWLGTCGLVGWELHRWLPAFTGEPVPAPADARVDHRLWQRCGVVVVALYLGYCLATGEVYRPRGARPDELGFYLFPAIALAPVVTLLVERRRLRRPAAAR